MPAFEKHVFVCTNVRTSDHPRGCCAGRDSEAIRDRLKSVAAEHGLKGRIRVNSAGCLDQCEHGPTLVVYPEGTWYGFVTLADVEEIVQSHLVQGRPVERLRLPDECINSPRCLHRNTEKT